MKAVLVCSLFVLSLPLLFAQKACIQGRVVDTNGSPIASMYVTITNREIGVSLPSAHDGTFSIDPLPPGKYDLATSEDRPDLAARQSGTEKDPALVQAVATEGKCASVILRRPERAQLRLTAKNQLTGEKISDVAVAYRQDEQKPWSESVEEEQNMLLPPLMDLQLRVGAPGYATAALSTPALQPGEQRAFDLLLRPITAGCIKGRVVDEQDRPVMGAKVQPELQGDPPRPEIAAEATDKNGEFQFGPVPPGQYVVAADALSLGYSPVTGSVEFADVQPSSGCSEVTVNVGMKAANLKLNVVDARTHRPLKYKGAASGEDWVVNLSSNPRLVPALSSMRLRVSADGYHTAETEIGPFQSAGTSEITVELIAK